MVSRCTFKNWRSLPALRLSSAHCRSRKRHKYCAVICTEEPEATTSETTWNGLKRNVNRDTQTLFTSAVQEPGLKETTWPESPRNQSYPAIGCSTFLWPKRAKNLANGLDVVLPVKLKVNRTSRIYLSELLNLLGSSIVRTRTLSHYRTTANIFRRKVFCLTILDGPKLYLFLTWKPLL